MSDVAERLKNSLADRYRIERELGEGGMATVFLAQDVRHDRSVALKVFRPELAAILGGERFLHEIKTTANLQHPHILGLIDSGEADRLLWYVMPYIEGETLRALLHREHQLPVEEAVRLAGEVAGALDYAHRRGVIHRDIKPENILLQERRALVADFGIALAVSSAGGARITQTGISLGTPQYMSPEQAMGERNLDARSDIYSLGAMLYEMLAGEPPHTGATAQAIMAKVLTEKPPLVSLARDSVPPHVAAAIQKALSKLPADRFATAAQFAEALNRPGTVAATAATGAYGAGAVDGAAANRKVALWVVGAIGFGLAAGALGWVLHRAPAPRTFPVEFSVEPDSSHSMELNTFVPLALAPDGTRLAYLGRNPQGSVQIYERRLDQRNARPIEGSLGADHPFYSPDGEWIAFDDGGQLKKVRVTGGTAVVIARIGGTTTGGAWSTDGTIVFSSGTPRALYRVSSEGGTPEPVTVPDTASGENHVRPSFLPDGNTVLFSSFRGDLSIRLGILTLDTRRVKFLEVPALIPKYLLSGELLYTLLDGSLMTRPFSATGLDFTGPPRALANGLSAFNRVAPTFDASTGGVVVFRPGGSQTTTTLVLVDRRGAERALFSAPDLWAPRFAPDGERVAYARQGAGVNGRDVWVYSIPQNSQTRITKEFGNAVDPSWSPDGRRLVFSAGEISAMDLYSASPDGGDTPAPLLVRPGAQYQPVFARDGKALVFLEVGAGGDLFRLPPGSTRPEPVVQTPFDETAPALSPDGKWLAYHSDESGQYEVYVRAFPGPGPRVVISSGGGREPVWSSTGREIFYRTGSRLVAAAVSTGATVTVRERTPLFDLRYLPGRGNRNYDAAPDENHFVFIKTPAEQRLVVRLNALAPEPR